MILQIALLIVWLYLAIAFTLFFLTLNKKDKDILKIKSDNYRREEKINKILRTIYKIDNQLNQKSFYKKK